MSSDAYDIAKDTLAEHKQLHQHAQTEYNEKVLSITNDRAYLGKHDRVSISHQSLYRYLGRDDLYRRVKGRRRTKLLIGLLGGGLIVSGIVMPIVKSWQITLLENEQNDFFNPDPPEHVPARKPYWIAGSAMMGVGALIAIYAYSFYTADKTTAGQRVDMDREHNEALRRRLGLASASELNTHSATKRDMFSLGITPLLSPGGGGLALLIRY